jgi:hypothetical protein
MVAVVVTRDEQVDGVNAEGSQIGRDGGCGARVDDDCFATFAHECGIALADVEEADFELLGGDPPRRQCDGEGEAQERETLHDRSIIGTCEVSA